MDLPHLIAQRRRQTGDDLRTMEERARDVGHPISRSTISDYARGKVDRPPSKERIRALAAALDCTVDEVAAAAAQSFGFDVGNSAEERRTSQRAQAWVRLTGGRTDEEIEELLLIVEQVLRMRDMDRPNGSAKIDDAPSDRP